MSIARICKAFLLCCTAVTTLSAQNAMAQTSPQVDTSAKAAVLIELKTGAVLLAHQEELPLPMASTTKVMTALLALESSSPDEPVVAGKNAYGVPGTSIYLDLDESLSMRDMLYGLLLASGNDAAVAIAEHVAGSTTSFCERMTNRARELGCEQTVFINPHGLPAQGHQTTALELAMIAREAMRHELFREIVSTQRATIPWQGRSYDRVLNNKNRLLREYPGAFGIKTGFTRAAGRCLVFGASRDGMEVVGVVLNCPDWFDEAERLLDEAFSRYEFYTAYQTGDMLRAVPVENGQTELAYIRAGSDLCAVVPKGTVPQLQVLLPSVLPAGVEAGSTVGQASLYNGEKLLATIPLMADETVPAIDFAFELNRALLQWLPFPVQSVGN